MSIIYVVQRCGVYPQGVYLVEPNKKRAIEAATQMARDDSDAYHDWEVHRVRVGKIEALSDPVFETNKDRATGQPPNPKHGRKS